MTGSVPRFKVGVDLHPLHCTIQQLWKMAYDGKIHKEDLNFEVVASMHAAEMANTQSWISGGYDKL